MVKLVILVLFLSKLALFGATRVFQSGPAELGSSYSGSGALLITDSLVINSGSVNWVQTGPIHVQSIVKTLGHTGSMDLGNYNDTIENTFSYSGAVSLHHSGTLYFPGNFKSFFMYNNGGNFFVDSQVVIMKGSGTITIVQRGEVGIDLRTAYSIGDTIQFYGSTLFYSNMSKLTIGNGTFMVNDLLILGMKESTGFLNMSSPFKGVGKVYLFSKVANKHFYLPNFIDSCSGDLYIAAYAENDTIDIGNITVNSNLTVYSNSFNNNTVYNFYNDTILQRNVPGTNTATFVQVYMRDINYITQNQPRFNFNNCIIHTGNYGFTTNYFPNTNRATYRFVNTKIYNNGGIFKFEDSPYDTVDASGLDVEFCDEFMQHSWLAGSNTYFTNDKTFRDITVNLPAAQTLTIVDSLKCRNFTNISGGLDWYNPVIMSGNLDIRDYDHSSTSNSVIWTASKYVFTATNPICKIRSPSKSNLRYGIEFTDGAILDVDTVSLGKLIMHKGTFQFYPNALFIVNAYVNGDFDGNSQDQVIWTPYDTNYQYSIKLWHPEPTVSYMSIKNLRNTSIAWINGSNGTCIDNGNNVKIILNQKCYCVPGR